MSVTSASRLSILLGFLALGCAERPLSAEETMSSSGPAIHFVTGAGEVTRTFLPEQVDVKLTGLPPASRVTLRASMPGFASHATFVADAAGAVDVAAQAPEEGTYEGADAEGLFWSMLSTGAASAGEPEHIDVDVRAELEGKVVATATLARDDTAPGVVETPVHDDGLVAVLVTPAAPGPHPALLTFGGSEGGIDWGRKAARLYASLGYTCLGLAYFGAPGLPQHLEDLPLEYFGKALAWLKQRPEVKADAIGVMGVSRGGELALLLGAHFPDVKAVVAQVPSGVVWPGWDPDQAENNTGSWTLGGKELSYVKPSDTPPKFTRDGKGHEIRARHPHVHGRARRRLDGGSRRRDHAHRAREGPRAPARFGRRSDSGPRAGSPASRWTASRRPGTRTPSPTTSSATRRQGTSRARPACRPRGCPSSRATRTPSSRSVAHPRASPARRATNSRRSALSSRPRSSEGRAPHQRPSTKVSYLPFACRGIGAGPVNLSRKGWPSASWIRAPLACSSSGPRSRSRVNRTSIASGPCWMT